MRHKDTKEDENLVIWKMNSTQKFFFQLHFSCPDSGTDISVVRSMRNQMEVHEGIHNAVS